MVLVTETSAWKDVQETHNTIGKSFVLKKEFESDPKRFEKYSKTFKNSSDNTEILFDFSKNFINEKILASLVKVAKEQNLEGLRDAMFKGEKINFTEGRAVYHAALRNTSNEKMEVDGKSVVEDVNSVLDHMKVFSEEIRSGSWKGHTGKPLTNIVNIGIGGSDL